ncbi:MAG: hypothetical protein H6982_09520, partial [Chromatiales bacterium]|nr:hypothetical protein [Chromatiales bacterium]
MSLIAGICHSGPGTLDRDRVRRAARAIADSRRPSAQIWLGAAGVLTGRATPVGSTAWLESPRGGSVAGVVDARLDDRETLARALRGRGWVLDEADDAALVVAACGQWGKDAPRHLLGDFAFAVWEVARERLICGRDP